MELDTWLINLWSDKKCLVCACNFEDWASEEDCHDFTHIASSETISREVVCPGLTQSVTSPFMPNWKELVAQSRLTLCGPMNGSLPGSSVHGILQARILQWIAISFSRGPPDSGIEPGSPASQADCLPSEPPGKPGFSWRAENHFNERWYGRVLSSSKMTCWSEGLWSRLIY